ncbi:hypothetical protein BDZ97DRAFT_1807264 [Flammula alnicola]|nr:hypothetical protein BDZ97DRAFT_1807264 [Flammula alnicola]
MNRLLLLRPISRAVRVKGSAACSRNLNRAFATTTCQKFGATSTVNKRKKMAAVDAQFFGLEEDEGEEVLPKAFGAASGSPSQPSNPAQQLEGTQQVEEPEPVSFIDPANFVEDTSPFEDLSLEEEESYTSAYMNSFDPNEYFPTWFSKEAKEAVEARGGTQYDYVCALLETPTTLDVLGSLSMNEMEDFERLWLLYEENKDKDLQAVVPILTFLLRHGAELKAPSVDAPKADACVALINPRVVEQGLECVKTEQWKIKDDSKPPHAITPYPDLMQSDSLLDPRDVLEFPATQALPFNNRVVVRNHRSVFHDYAEGTEDDLLEDDELDGDAESEGADDMLKALPVQAKYYHDLHQSILMRRSVVQQTGKGKIRRVAFMVLVGDGNGLVGYGEGKHSNGAVALKAARLAAVKNMDWVERFEKRTIWTEMSTKLGATQLILRPRPVGFGLRCNPFLHQILRAAGMKDISAKVWGSRNRLNVIKAAFRMLHAGHAPTGMGDGIGGKGKKLSKGGGVRGKSDLERARGRKLINLRK